MAVNYAIDTSQGDSNLFAATFSGGSTADVAYAEAGSTSYLASVEFSANRVNFWKFNPDTVSGTVASTTATFTTGTNPRSVEIYYLNSTTAYLFSADSGSNRISFWRFNPSTVSGTVASTTATFTTGTNPQRIVFIYNGSSSYLLSSDPGSNRLSFWRFDPSTVSGTVASTTATFTASGPSDITLYANGTTGYVTNSESGIVRFFRFNPTTVSGTQTSVATFSTGSSGGQSLVISGTNAYLSCVNGSSDVDFYRFNPTTVSTTGINPDARFRTKSTYPQNTILYLNSSNVCFLLSCEFDGAISYWRFDPTTISGPLIPVSSFFSITAPNRIRFVINGSNSRLFAATGSGVTYWLTDLNDRALAISLSPAQYLNTRTAAFRKTVGGTLTLYSSVGAFQAWLLLRAGAQAITSGLGNQTYGWAFTASDDSTGTLSESLTFSGSTAGITGNYRITMASGTTTTLANKGTYNDSFTLASGSTLVLTANATLTEEFVLSSGVTVNASGGSWTLTIPYGNPGLTIGSGVTVITPQPTITLTGLIAGTEVRVYDSGTTTELAGIETSSTSFSFSISGYSSIDISIISDTYKNRLIKSYPIPSNNVSIPIEQLVDIDYLNP